MPQGTFATFINLTRPREYHFWRRGTVLTPDSEKTPREGILEPDTHAIKPQKIRIEQHSLMGCLWFAAWLFAIGFLHLSFWRGVLAMVVWPYFIGHYVSTLMR